MSNYSENEVETIKRHVRAVTRLTLGDKAMKPGLAILAGDPVDSHKKLELARLARESDCDLVHLSFDHTTEGFRMVSIQICVPRDFAVYSHSNCRLSLLGERAIIMPPERIRGHFLVTPGEIIHKPVKPYGWEQGIYRAEQRLRELVESGVDTTGQIALHAVESTA